MPQTQSVTDEKSNLEKEKKQNADQSSGNPKCDGYEAEKLGAESIYEDETEIAQRMRRGNAGKKKGNELDVVEVVEK